MIRNIEFAINFTEFNTMTATLSIFETSFGKFSGSNIIITSCFSKTSYIVSSFNSILFFESITSNSFSNGFFLIQSES